MLVPVDYQGPKLEIILRTNKPDNSAEVIEKLFDHVKKS